MKTRHRYPFAFRSSAFRIATPAAPRMVLWTSPSGGSAYYILAHAYIAAVLNGLNGADTSAVSSQIAHAAALFGIYTPTSTLSRAVRADFIATAVILDNYNNGLIGPGHCSK